MSVSTVPRRTQSTKFRAVRGSMNESPPPPPSRATMREWFAGLALMNAELMQGVAPDQRGAEAVCIADQLIAALEAPRTPSSDSVAAPTNDALEQMRIRNDQLQAAIDAHRRVTSRGGSVAPPPLPTFPAVNPATACFRRASQHLQQQAPTPRPPSSAGRYSIVPDSDISVVPDDERPTLRPT